MIGLVYSLVNLLILLVTLLILLKVLISYFMDPYQPVRLWVDRLVEPMLRPIRRIIPPIGMVDISPIILIILVQIGGRLLLSLIAAIPH